MIKNGFVILIILLMAGCSVTELKPSVYHREAEKYLERAKKALAETNYQKSFDYIDDALHLSHASNLPEIKIKALLQKANILLFLNQHKEAAFLIKEAKETAENEVKSYLPYVYYAEAVYQWESGNYEEARKILEAMKEQPDNIKPAYHNLMALIEFKNKNIAEALESVKLAIKAAEKTGDFEQISYAKKIDGQLKTSQNNLAEAIDAVLNSLEIDRKLGNRAAIMWDLDFLGNRYLDMNKKDEAFYYLYQGYELAVAIGDREKRDYFLEKAYLLLK